MSRDRVFVNETADETYEAVYALDRKTGDVIWRTQWEGAMKVDPMGSRTGSWIKSTPTFDGERLYIDGMRDVLVCLDAETGRELWRADFMERFGGPIPELGFISSPPVVGNAVVSMAADSVVSVDKYTGAARWRNVVRDVLGHGSYSSAELGVLHGRPQILASTIPAMNGLDPESGEFADPGKKSGIEIRSNQSRIPKNSIPVPLKKFTIGGAPTRPSTPRARRARAGSSTRHCGI